VKTATTDSSFKCRSNQCRLSISTIKIAICMWRYAGIEL